MITITDEALQMYRDALAENDRLRKALEQILGIYTEGQQKRYHRHAGGPNSEAASCLSDTQD